MIKLSSLFKKISIIAFVAVFALAALPVTSVSASGQNDQATLPVGTSKTSGERLEQVWARLQRVYERQGRLLERADKLAERCQSLIDLAKENGKDVSALQAALDTFENALKEAHPLHESAKGLINSHQGFDAEGKATDPEKAAETVQSLRDKLQEVRGLVGEPGKALRESVKAFRAANLTTGLSSSI